MPVKRILAKTLLPLLTVVSFSCGVIIPIYEDYFHDESREVSLFLNGEIMGKRYKDGETYKDYCIEDDGMKVIERLSEGENVLLYCAVGDCPSCIRTMPKFCELLSYVPFETYLLHADFLSDTSSLHDAYARITASFPNLGVFANAVPKAYLLSPTKEMTILSPSSNAKETGDLASYLGGYFRVNNIVRFQNEEGFAGFLNEESTIGYVYSDSLTPFRSNELPSLETSKKKVGLLKSGTISEGYYKMDNGLTPITKEEAYSALSIGK